MDAFLSCLLCSNETQEPFGFDCYFVFKFMVHSCSFLPSPQTIRIRKPEQGLQAALTACRSARWS